MKPRLVLRFFRFQMPLDTITRTYRLNRATVTRLDSLATELGFWPSQLVDALLDHVLAEIEAGRLTAERRPVKWTLCHLRNSAPKAGG
jgi:hypothetical protein